MLAFAGDIPGLTGVGVGVGFCCGDDALVSVLTDAGALRATAPLAMANEFSNKPEAHARAHVLMATFLGDCLGIIPSSGDEAEFAATRALEPPEVRTFKARAAHRGNSVCLSNVNK